MGDVLHLLESCLKCPCQILSLVQYTSILTLLLPLNLVYMLYILAILHAYIRLLVVRLGFPNSFPPPLPCLMPSFHFRLQPHLSQLFSI